MENFRIVVIKNELFVLAPNGATASECKEFLKENKKLIEERKKDLPKHKHMKTKTKKRITKERDFRIPKVTRKDVNSFSFFALLLPSEKKTPETNINFPIYFKCGYTIHACFSKQESINIFLKDISRESYKNLSTTSAYDNFVNGKDIEIISEKIFNYHLRTKINYLCELSNVAANILPTEKEFNNETGNEAAAG